MVLKKSYRVLVEKTFQRKVKHLPLEAKRLIEDFIRRRLQGCENPRAFGHGLSANLAGLWRYRVGDYRIICDIQDEQLIVIALACGRRDSIYSD
ncbi:cytotoxic translational repressor of toxin-antitoxin stability system [Jonquetella anthropi DSM 22815]|uniref:Cytotoxic translational repressor of toxin-antitoxin stability system n=1 Tax=Jonquetella anthropi DSM 22815 TaxID=885272 RepID=H0ULW0_9BACT|nr:type II toxin-antitoxin system RelE/ParE family toxin [Jonquetella anthropi]EHM13601.1 cytotoxic translational repressor of toxin-antitoxin stability system [Jonquetella anthropi DSM 22815]